MLKYSSSINIIYCWCPTLSCCSVTSFLSLILCGRCGIWEETGALRENPRRDRNSVQTSHTQERAPRFKVSSFCCEATVLTAVLPRDDLWELLSWEPQKIIKRLHRASVLSPVILFSWSPTGEAGPPHRREVPEGTLLLFLLLLLSPENQRTMSIN